MNLTESIAPRSDQEVWVWIPSYEGQYEISNLGAVRGVNRLDSRGRNRPGKLLSPTSAISGHLFVGLCRDGIRERVGVHALVLISFVGPRPNKHDACHWNDNPRDNRLQNLRWDTQHVEKVAMSSRSSLLN
jgi:hypothetical protein